MYPHERSLVKRLANKPFALIGINSDRDKAQLKQVMKQENITWRSFWNGPQGTRGPISTAWGVRAWPTIYVLDHNGIIRFKNVRGEAMDKAVDVLLAELDSLPPGSVPAATPANGAERREWTDATGLFKVTAELVDFKDGQAWLKKEDGTVLKVSIGKLSKEDQLYVRETLKARRQ